MLITKFKKVIIQFNVKQVMLVLYQTVLCNLHTANLYELHYDVTYVWRDIKVTVAQILLQHVAKSVLRA